MATREVSGKRTRMPRAQRERQMVAVAEEIFAQRGYRDAVMDDIAARVGVSKPMLYAYFGSKEGLLRAVIAKFHTDLHDHVTAVWASSESVSRMLWRGIAAYHEFIARHTAAWAVVRDVGGRAVNDQIDEIRRGQAELVSLLLEKFVPAMPEDEREAAGHLVVGACERVELWRQNRGDVTAGQAASLVHGMVWPGLRERAASFGADLDASG